MIFSVFAQKIASYINTGMKQRNLTYEDLRQLTGVPTSTLHSWAQGRVTKPNDEYLVRIAQAFGDPPEIIQRMRHESLAMTTETNMLIAQAHDKELMEKFVELINANTARLLEQSRIDSDNRYVSRLNTVRDQYNRLYEEQRANFADQLAESKSHAAQTYMSATNYLKGEIDYYRRALLRVVLVSIALVLILGAYAVYCFRTFDKNDPFRGLSRQTPVVITTAAPDQKEVSP